MTRKGYLLATAGSVAAAAAGNGAQAADMAVKAPPPMPVAAVSWTGWYAGVNVGVGREWSDAAYTGSEQDTTSRGTHLDGDNVIFIGGGQIGYNWQSSNYIFGLEADISGLSGNANSSGSLGEPGKGSGLNARIDWLSTFRGRAGVLVTDNSMVYATGGLAVGGVKDTFGPNGIGACDAPGLCTKSVSKTAVGWVVGGGYEYMFNRNWTIGLEGLFVNLGTTTGHTPNPS